MKTEISAWITQMDADPKNVDDLRFYNVDMTDCGWVKVGIAKVEVELIDDADRLQNQLDMLDEAERRAEAECQRIKTSIEGQRQRLLAIEYKP